MTKYKKQNFKNTFKNARKGFRLSLKSERNLRIHLITGLFVLISAYCLNFSITKFCVIFLTITAVITAEMFNSAIEFTLDAMYHNKYSRLVGMAKDISAGAVMITTVMAIFIGVLLFAPPIITLLTK